MNTREDFVTALLAGLNLKDTKTRRLVFYAWMCAENTEAQYNPMATTHIMPGATDFNTTHVKDYLSMSQGVQATIATLLNGHYTKIVNLLKLNAPAWTTGIAIEHSVWGTHDFRAGLQTARHRDTSQTLLGHKS
jgi:hypothetical protein